MSEGSGGGTPKLDYVSDPSTGSIALFDPAIDGAWLKSDTTAKAYR